MRLGERSWASTTSVVAVLTLSVIFGASALSIGKRESATEQVLVITTPLPSDLVLQDEGTTPPSALQLEMEQNDDPSVVGTTVDTIVVQDSTATESFEFDHTSSGILSKDVEIEIATSENSNKLAEGGSDTGKPVLPEIYSFRVESDIQYRYSRTHITSRVANKDLKQAQEVTFTVVLPETAFISKFIMEIDGKAYEAYVKEKEEAKKDYVHAQSQGQSAGLIEKSTRNSNVFNVNVNVKPQTKVTFNLTYEELLQRRLGRYEQAININPDQVSSIKDYQIVVNIEESRNLTFIRVPSLSNDIDGQTPEGNNPDAVVERPAANKAKISWSPSSSDQKKMSKEGLSGKFVVQYDVDRASDAGHILVMQGYFVHFFAPENLPPLKKHVVFILDISGSMWGRKMEQLKESQTKILDDLSSDDYFNIITFSSDVYLWSPNDNLSKTKHSEFRQPSFPAMSEFTPPELLARKQPLPASRENVDKAKAFIDSLVASGGTNIHDAVIEGLNLTAAIKDAQQKVHGGSSTEPGTIIETTIIYSSTSSSVSSSSSASPASLATAETSTSSSSTTSTSTTTAASSSSSSTTQGSTDDDDENRTVDIIDIAKSEPLDIMSNDMPEESATARPGSGPSKVVLPANVQSLIIFLTDGEPTVGITDPPEIQKLIQLANRNLSVPIFSLGFGEGADFPFLKKLSLQNNGFGRKIYEASDAALQLKGFYNEIASPLLSNVTFNYTSEEYNITDVTVTRFPTVFGGTEIAVAGKLVAPPKPERLDSDEEEDDESTIVPSQKDEPLPTPLAETPALGDVAPPNRLSIACDFEQSDRYFFDVNIEGIGRDGEVDLSHVEVYERPRCGLGIDFPPIFFQPPAGSQFPPRPTPPPTPEDTFLERLWAYLTIQQLIEKDLAGGDSTPSGDSNVAEADNSVESEISPTSTLAPSDETSIVTKVLPDHQGSTTPTPLTANITSKSETPKERALRLALKYGFVTPLTSLVVVKPNSSDVTNAVPTDARPDAFDSLYGRSKMVRRISFQAPIVTPVNDPNAHIMHPHPIQRSYRPAYSGSLIMVPQSITANSDPSVGAPGAHSRPRGFPHRGRGGRKKAGWRSNNAPQSMSLAMAAPGAGFTGIRNKIAYSPVPISSNYLSRPIPPVPLVAAGHFGQAPPPAFGFGGGPPGGFGGVDYSLGADVQDAQEESVSFSHSPVDPVGLVVPTVVSTTFAPTRTTTMSSKQLTLSDITWLAPEVNTIRINETDYQIARNHTSDDNEGHECANAMNGSKGECRHLQSCVLPAFATDQSVFTSSYFCGIQSKSSAANFAGVCCPSNKISRHYPQISDEDP